MDQLVFVVALYSASCHELGTLPSVGRIAIPTMGSLKASLAGRVEVNLAAC